MTDVIEAMARAVQLQTGIMDWTWESGVRAALSAALERGWKLVPVEPTEEMLEVGAGNAGDWRAMLEKAPKP